MAELKITYRPISGLSLRQQNPRTHSNSQIQQIVKSINNFGFTNPVLIDAKDCVVAGHGRIEAAKQLGMNEVPTILLRDMSDEDIRAYVIADNKLAENAGWDHDILALEFQYLKDLEIDFDLTLTGFEIPEIAIALQSLVLLNNENAETEAVPLPCEGPSVTRTGDVWHIGSHRLICGDSTKHDTYAELLRDERAQMVFSDPPYNVPIDGHVSGKGEHKHREFAMGSGEMSSEVFQNFLQTVFGHQAAFSNDGAIHYQCMDWRHMSEILAAGKASYNELKTLCVWAKSNGGMGSLYRSQHELVFVFKSGNGKHINNVQLGKHGRNRTNLWTYAGANAFGPGQDDLALHPTVKPTALVRDAILDCSNRGGIILDAFCGSGSTLLAAAETGRRGFGIEIDPLYCDVILRRMIDQFNLPVRRAADGVSFDEAEKTLSHSLEAGYAG